MYRILLACTVAVLLSGCGQTGPLYLPEEENVPPPPEAVPAPPAVQSSEQSAVPAGENATP